jgi:SAM-dependent methyltransferase
MTITTDVEFDTSASDDEGAVAALAGRVFEAGLGAFELLSTYVGQELGLYDALAAQGPTTAAGLASSVGIHGRYAREWLEQQAIAGFLEVDDPQRPPEERVFRLPAATGAVLVDPSSLAYLAPFGSFVVALGQLMPQLLDAYRTGDGISFGAFGDTVREAQAALNRPAYENLLADWVREALPDVHERLSSLAGARVADLGCGCGWSTLALARAYPQAHVDGIDSDGPSITTARRHAAQADLDNVRFEARDAADPAPADSYDLVCVFEALHDMPHPAAVLQAAAGLLAPGGSILLMDERVADAFGAVGEPIERFMYACSVIHCLPVGMAGEASEANGTVLRTSTVEQYAATAGLTVTVLPIEHDCWRFYRLVRS